MDSTTLTALLGFFGTVVGSVGGILASARLTTYRLKQLEEKVKAHNTLVTRMVEAETKIKNLVYRVTELEHEHE